MQWLETLIKKLFGDPNDKIIRSFQPIVDQINEFEESLKLLSDEELKEKTSFFKSQLSSGKSLDDILPEAFAVVREASVRTLKMRHFDVPLKCSLIFLK